MEKDRYHLGLDKLNEFTLQGNPGISTHYKIADDLSQIAPDIMRYIVEFAYGDIYTRPGLENRERSLVVISSLATQGTLPQLELHINTGLTAGLSPKEIVEAIIQLIPYTGFPAVINSLKVAKKVFAERQLTVEQHG